MALTDPGTPALVRNSGEQYQTAFRLRRRHVGLFDAEGRRLCITEEERRAFIAAAVKASSEVRTFCGVLHATGCRISEALALAPRQIDLSGLVVVFESLKRHKRGATKAPLWPWSRMTSFRRVHEVMEAAAIAAGPHACPKGLRYGFGVRAISRGIDLNMVQKWLGDAA